MTLRPHPMIALLFLAAACGEKSDPALDVMSAEPEVAAAAAGLTARDSMILAADVGELVARSFSPGIGNGPMIFNAPAGCSHQIAFEGGEISLEHDCTTP